MEFLHKDHLGRQDLMEKTEKTESKDLPAKMDRMLHPRFLLRHLNHATNAKIHQLGLLGSKDQKDSQATQARPELMVQMGRLEHQENLD